MSRALAAWEKVPPGSSEFGGAALGRGRAALRLGRFALAEECFRASLGHRGANQPAAFIELRSLLRNEGRLDEVRRLLMAHWERFGSAPANLTALWKLDVEPMPEIEEPQEAPPAVEAAAAPEAAADPAEATTADADDAPAPTEGGE